MVSFKRPQSYMYQIIRQSLVLTVLFISSSFSVLEEEFNNCDTFKVESSIIDTKEDRRNGEVSVTVYGGMAPYTYVLIDEHSKVINKDYSLNQVKNLSKGTYSFHVYDSKGCTKEIEIRII